MELPKATQTNIARSLEALSDKTRKILAAQEEIKTKEVKPNESRKAS